MGSRLRPVSIRTVRSLDDAVTGGALIVREGFIGSFGVSVVSGRSLGPGMGVSVGLTNGFRGLVGNGRILGTVVGVSVGLANGLGTLVASGCSLGTVVGVSVGLANDCIHSDTFIGVGSGIEGTVVGQVFGLSNGLGVTVGFGRNVGVGVGFATSNK